MTFDQWLDIAWKVASAFGGTLALVGMVFWWIMLRGFVSKAEHASHWVRHDREHDELDDRLSAGDRQFTRLGSDMEHRPSSGTIDELRQAISTLNASVAALSANDHALAIRMSHMESQLDRLVEFHLKGGK